MATSERQLPPEMVDVIRGELSIALAENSGNLPADITLRIGRALAPLLAKRDVEKDAAIGRLQAAYRSLDADWGRSRAEARRLREALEEIADRSRGDLVGARNEIEAIARAALSASPDPEMRGRGRDRHGVLAPGRVEAVALDPCPVPDEDEPPVSVPEQEEGRAQCICHRGPQRGWSCPVHPPGAASSSSSEEGERAAHYEVDAGDGITARVYGAPDPSPESADAIRAVIRAAAEEMRDHDLRSMAVEYECSSELEWQAVNAHDALDSLGVARADELHDGAVYSLKGRIEAFAASLRERLTSDEAARTLRDLLARGPLERYGVGWHHQTKTYGVFDVSSVDGPSRCELVEGGFDSVRDAAEWITLAEMRLHLRALAAALLNDTKETDGA